MPVPSIYKSLLNCYWTKIKEFTYIDLLKYIYVNLNFPSLFSSIFFNHHAKCYQMLNINMRGCHLFFLKFKVLIFYSENYLIDFSNPVRWKA